MNDDAEFSARVKSCASPASGRDEYFLLSSLTLPTRGVVEGILLVCLLSSAWVFTPANSHVEAQAWSEPLNGDRLLSAWRVSSCRTFIGAAEMYRFLQKRKLVST